MSQAEKQQAKKDEETKGYHYYNNIGRNYTNRET